MKLSFLPKEFQFFDLFDKQCACVVKGTKYFCELVKNGNFNEETSKKMHEIENEADEITHDIIDKLNRTFITPFDREDIYSLAHELDAILDLINTITSRMRLYKLTVVNDKLIEFSGIIEKSVDTLVKAIAGLREMKKSQVIINYCIEVNSLENAGDQLRDKVLEELFDNNNDPLYIIKWKEIFEKAETVLDNCEDVANIVEAILVKQG